MNPSPPPRNNNLAKSAILRRENAISEPSSNSNSESSINLQISTTGTSTRYMERETEVPYLHTYLKKKRQVERVKKTEKRNNAQNTRPATQQRGETRQKYRERCRKWKTRKGERGNREKSTVGSKKREISKRNAQFYYT